MIQPRDIASFPQLPSGQAAPVLAYRAGAFVAIELTDLAAGDSVPVWQLGTTRRTDGAYLALLTYPTTTPEPPPTPIIYPDEGIPAPALPHTFEVLPGDEVLVFVGPLAFTGSRYEIRETDVRRASLEALAAYYATSGRGIGVWIIGSTFTIENL